jgi:hypothetical protein
MRGPWDIHSITVPYVRPPDDDGDGDESEEEGECPEYRDPGADLDEDDLVGSDHWGNFIMYDLPFVVKSLVKGGFKLLRAAADEMDDVILKAGANLGDDALKAAAKSTLPEWVNDAGSLVNHAKNLQEAGGTVTKEAADDIVRAARQHGVNVRLDPPHPNTSWDMPHLNVGKPGDHVPVPEGYVLPPGG